MDCSELCVLAIVGDHACRPKVLVKVKLIASSDFLVSCLVGELLAAAQKTVASAHVKIKTTVV